MNVAVSAMAGSIVEPVTSTVFRARRDRTAIFTEEGQEQQAEIQLAW